MTKYPVKEYAALCGVSATVVYKRIKLKEIKIKNGLIDVEEYPPIGAKPKGKPKLKAI